MEGNPDRPNFGLRPFIGNFTIIHPHRTLPNRQSLYIKPVASTSKWNEQTSVQKSNGCEVPGMFSVCARLLVTISNSLVHNPISNVFLSGISPAAFLVVFLIIKGVGKK